MNLHRRAAKQNLPTGNTSLVIIDMQPDTFQTSRDEDTILACIKAIEKAIEDDIPIFVVEYEGSGRTNQRLRCYLNGYEHTRYVVKNSDSGARVIIECMEQNDWDIKTFRVCGVNTQCCVASTIRILVRKFDKQIEVIKEGCNTFGARKFDSFTSTTFNNKNVVLV